MRTRMGSSKPVSQDADRLAGFSLIEVSVVILISLIIGMITIPNMVTVISNARLHAGVTSMSSLLQSCRMAAVKQNRALTAHFTIDGSTLIGYVKEAPDTSDVADTDLQAQWESPVRMETTPTGADAPAVIDTDVLGFTPQDGEPTFNTRGLPCFYDGVACENKGFVYYFKDTSRSNGKGWASLSISPAGRIKKWFWNGAEWKD